MIEQTATNRFIVPPSGNQEALYQHLQKGFISYDLLGNRLIHLAEQARMLRQVDALSELSLILCNFPVEHYRIIGQYYFALSICRNGQGNLEHASTIFEKVASNGPVKYRAEAMLSLAAISWIEQQPEEIIRYCLEASMVGNFSTSMQALMGMAVVKSQEGFHLSALNDLEKLYPLFRSASPYYYFKYLNSYAVELSEVGRLQEAGNVSQLVIDSPFIQYYPEWQETHSEIKRKQYKRRSTVSVSIPKSKPTPKAKPVKEPNLARILKFPQPKAKELYKGMEMPALTPIQWLAAMLKTKYGPFIELFIPDADDDIDRFCDAYLDLVINFYE